MEDKVFVYLVRLDKFVANVGQFEKLLSDEELERANRFQIKIERTRYLIRHGIFRKVLSQFSSIPLFALKIRNDENKKPFLSVNNGEHRVNFSLSSSENLFAFCLGNNIRLGIDIEIIHDDPDFKVIAKVFYSKKENKFLEKMPKEKQAKAFLRIWTAKEAFIKANRLIEPDQFSIDLAETSFQIKPLEFDNQQWHFYNPAVSNKYILTISSNKPMLHFQFKEIDNSDLPD